VIAVLHTPARRIAFAIALSVLLHAIILWLPYIHLPHAKVELPPLTVRLEPLPKPAEHPAAISGLEQPLTRSAGHPSIMHAPETRPNMDKTKLPASANPFPKHLQLTFIVHKSESGFMTGEIHHQLDIHNDRYILKSVRQTAGLISLRNSDRLIQTSQGKIGKHGLQPDSFEEEEITKEGKHSLQAVFDWTKQKLRFSNGDEIALPADAQDSLSFMYQLSQLQMNGEFFPIVISDATQLREYQIEIGAKENIDTPMGKLRALHLRKMHADGEAYFEIWLGLEHRLLPVKFSRVDALDNVTEEYVISEIRATNE
jgi:hypothetical protein